MSLPANLRVSTTVTLFCCEGSMVAAFAACKAWAATDLVSVMVLVVGFVSVVLGGALSVLVVVCGAVAAAVAGL